jgi:hypothetical protein
MTTMRHTADVTDAKPITVLSHPGSGAVNPLMAYYDIYRGIEVQYFLLSLTTHKALNIKFAN